MSRWPDSNKEDPNRTDAGTKPQIYTRKDGRYARSSRGDSVSRLEAVGARNQASDRGVCGTARAADAVGGRKPASTGGGR